MRSLVLGVAAASVAGAGWLQWGGTSDAATGPAQIRLTTKQVKYHRVDTGRSGRSPGDMEIITHLLYNKGVTPRALGHSEFVCTFTIDISRSCRATFFLPRGTLVVGGSLRFRQIYQLAVLGGTRLYDNARGTLTVTRLRKNPRRDLMLFRLIG
jgi:hypothetical protein